MARTKGLSTDPFNIALSSLEKHRDEVAAQIGKLQAELGKLDEAIRRMTSVRLRKKRADVKTAAQEKRVRKKPYWSTQKRLEASQRMKKLHAERRQKG